MAPLKELHSEQQLVPRLDQLTELETELQKRLRSVPLKAPRWAIRREDHWESLME